MSVWLYAHQDGRYKELEDWEKNYFWHLPLGPKAPMLWTISERCLILN